MNERFAGRKKQLNEGTIEECRKRRQAGESVSKLAEEYGVSRQTMSSYVNQSETEYRIYRNYVLWARLNKSFRERERLVAYNLRLDYMNEDKLCTSILVSEESRRVQIVNHTDDILHRAFGVIEYPDWEDYEEFLRERCLPSSRQLLKQYLSANDLPGLDPLALIEKTEGRMAEDRQWVKVYFYAPEANHAKH